MEQAGRVKKLLLGTALSAALLALGLAVTGNTARALSFVSPGPHVEGFHVFDGTARTVEQVTLNGRPATVQRCTHPDLEPAEVLAHYRKAARGETSARVPYLLATAPDGGGSVIWTTLDGTRKAALVQADPRGGSAFRLILEEPVTGRPRQAPVDPNTPLAGGLYCPAGFAVRFSLTHPDGTGTAVLEAPGSCREAAASVLGALGELGFAAAEEAERRVYDAHTSETRLTIPFAHRTGVLAGQLVVSPTRSRGARVCLTVRGG